MLEGGTEDCMIAKLREHSSNSALQDCYLAERVSVEFETSTVTGSRVELERQFWKIERDHVAIHLALPEGCTHSS